MFYFAKIGVQNNIFKEKAKNFEDINNKSKTSNLVNLFIFFCNQRRFLNKKVVNFFFHVVFLSVKKSAFKKQQMCLEEKKSILSYKVSVFFLRFVSLILCQIARLRLASFFQGNFSPGSFFLSGAISE